MEGGDTIRMNFKVDVIVWTGFNCFRTESMVGSCGCSKEPSDSIKGR
jgi:hypothetical protein